MKSTKKIAEYDSKRLKSDLAKSQFQVEFLKSRQTK